MANSNGYENAGNELGHMKRTILNVAKKKSCRVFVLILTTTTDGWMPCRCTLTSLRKTSSPVSIKVHDRAATYLSERHCWTRPQGMYDLDPTVQRVALDLIKPFLAILAHPSFTTCSPVTGWGRRVETTALVRMRYYTINSAVEITTCDMMVCG